ncbi:MAG: alpha/beta fold hydrolase [Gemmatimonadaceae bacterium]
MTRATSWRRTAGHAVRFIVAAAGVASLSTVPAIALAQPNVNGVWHGVLSTPGARLTLVFTFREGPGGGRTGEVESIDQGPGAMPLDQVVLAGRHLTFAIPSIGATVDAAWNDGTQSWSGTYRQGAQLPLVLVRGAPPSTGAVEGMEGVWRATLQRGAAALRLILHVWSTPYGSRASLDSPDMMAMGMQVDDFGRSGDSVRFHVPLSGVRYNATLDPAVTAMSGTWAREGQPVVQVRFARDSATTPLRARTQWPVVPNGYLAEEVSFANPNDAKVTLAGTLTLPDGAGPFPAVVLITGSGAQDRDETIFGHKPFAVLADALTRRGIAVLRYDDRGFAKSTGQFGSATSVDFATDARAAVRYLASRPEIDARRIGLAGHSEGGMVAPLAAVEDRGVAFVILLAGPGTRTERLMLAQSRMMGVTQGMSVADLDRREPVLRDIVHAVAASKDSTDAVARVRKLLTDERLTTLGVTSGERDPLVGQWTSRWMRYFLAYDPAPALARLRVPVLAIGGSLDVQVPAAENLAAIRAALRRNPDATVRELPGLNHFFQTATTGAVGEYEGIAETFAPAAMALVGEWIVQRFGGGVHHATSR